MPATTKCKWLCRKLVEANLIARGMSPSLSGSSVRHLFHPNCDCSLNSRRSLVGNALTLDANRRPQSSGFSWTGNSSEAREDAFGGQPWDPVRADPQMRVFRKGSSKVARRTSRVTRPLGREAGW
jgi:hypothetical protein